MIPEGTNVAQVVISASPRSEQQMMELQIEGTANCGTRTVNRRAVPSEDMMQAFIYRHLVTSQKLLVQICEPNPVTVTLNLPADGIIRARPGSEVSLSAVINRKSDGAGGVKLALSDAPEWLTLATDTIGLKTGNEIILKISPNAEAGDKATVLLNGTARVGKFSKEAIPTPKFLTDNKAVDFTIDALSLQIIE